jgi:hypothetical protein
MIRTVQSARVAVERLSDLVSHKVLCMPAHGGGYEIHIVSDLDLDPMHKTNAKEVLAFLADVAWRENMDHAVVDAAVMWRGNIPSQGFPAWQESALCWLKFGTLSSPTGD